MRGHAVWILEASCVSCDSGPVSYPPTPEWEALHKDHELSYGYAGDPQDMIAMVTAAILWAQKTRGVEL